MTENRKTREQQRADNSGRQGIADTLVRYFAYGSNMSRAQMHKRVPRARLVGSAVLRGYAFVFNKLSIDGSGKANIERSDGEDAVVYGCVYHMTPDEFETLKKFEKGYRVETINVVCEGERTSAETLVAEPSSVCKAPPTTDYLETILKAAELLKLPAEHVAAIRRAAGA